MMMKMKLLFVSILIVCFAADAAKAEKRRPDCPETEVLACGMNFAPVCGSDGVTYPNECALCVERQQTRKDIQVMKDESC